MKFSQEHIRTYKRAWNFEVWTVIQEAVLKLNHKCHAGSALDPTIEVLYDWRNRGNNRKAPDVDLQTLSKMFQQ